MNAEKHPHSQQITEAAVKADLLTAQRNENKPRSTTND